MTFCINLRNSFHHPTDIYFFPFLDKQEREHILEVNLTYPQLQGLETAYIARFGEIAGVTDVLPMDKDLFGGYLNISPASTGI